MFATGQGVREKSGKSGESCGGQGGKVRAKVSGQRGHENIENIFFFKSGKTEALRKQQHIILL